MILFSNLEYKDPLQYSETFPQVVRTYLKEMGIFTERADGILKSLEEEGAFFPRNQLNDLADSGIFDVHFFRLLFLCFQLERVSRAMEKEDKELKKFSPFSKKQRNSFRKAKRAAKTTEFFLHFYVAGTIFLFLLLFPWVGYVSLSNLPPAASIAISIGGGCLSALALSFAGLFITGTLPDHSSRKANEAQNHSRALHTSYRYMSQRLLELYSHIETTSLAQEIAMFFNKNNRRRLKNRLLDFLSDTIVNQLIHSLKEVHMFIREGSRNTALLNPDLTTHWLTLESNSMINLPRACDLNILFKPKIRSSDGNINDNDVTASNSLSNSFTSFDFEEI